MASIKRYTSPRAPRGYAWRVQYRGPDGKPHTKRGFTTKDEAQAWADHNATTIRDGTWIGPTAGHTTINQLAVEYFDTSVHLKPSTRALTESTWKVHVQPHWGEWKAADITRSDIQKWVAHTTWSPSTARRAYDLLRQILNVAVAARRLPVNPCSGVKLPRKPPPRHIYLTMGQLSELIDECTVHKEIVGLLGLVGLRWGEVAGLQVRDVERDRNRILVRRNAVTVGGEVVVGSPKTYEQRSVVVPSVLMDQIRAHVSGKSRMDWVFPGRDGGPMKKLSGRHFLRTAVERIQKRDPDFPSVTPHGLRHVAAGLMVSVGANVKVVQRQLGHSSAAMTLDTYADLFDEDLDLLGERLDSALRADVVKLSSS